MARFSCMNCVHFKGKWGINGCAKACSADPRIGQYYYDGYKSTLAGCVSFERREITKIIQPQKTAVA